MKTAVVSIYGFGTTILVVALMIVVLCLVTKSASIYEKIHPNLVLFFSFLIILRIVFNVEFFWAKEIRFHRILPAVDTMLRYQLMCFDGERIRLWMFLILGSVFYSLLKTCRLFVQYLTIRKELWEEEAVPQEETEILEKARVQMGVRRKVYYRKNSKYFVPMIFGCFKPVVIIPERLLEGNSRALYLTTCHEMNHEKYRDCLTKFLLELFSCVFWWVPFKKYLLEKMDEAVEIRADWRLVRNMTDKQRIEYMQLLYHIAAETKALESRLFYIRQLVGSRSGTMTKRFRFIANHKKWNYTMVLMLLSVLIFFSSYLYVIQPKYRQKSAEDFKERCTAYEQKDGTYQIYSDNQYLGRAENLEFIKNERFEDVCIVVERYEPFETKTKQSTIF